jgi:hypothetical protein
MRFDPRIVRPDETLIDEELPDDLAALGAQLQDDARRLASCYPPRAAGNELSLRCVAPAPAARQRHWPLVLSGGVGGLIALGLAVALIVLDPDLLRTSWIKHETSHAPLASPQEAIASGRQRAERGVLPPVTPAVFSGGITGPEMEAWIDLHKEELAINTESLEF